LRPQQRFRLPDPQSSTGISGNKPTNQPTRQPADARAQQPLARTGAPGSPRPDAARTATTPPAGRYGEKPGMSRPRKVGLGVVGLAILGGVGGYIAWEMSHPAIQGTVTGFNATSATSVIVTFEVDKPADKSATCTLVAVDGHGAVIGTASVPILAGRAKNVQTYTLQTTTTANTVTVQTCKLTN
jgi:hypothetical protein